MDKTENNQEEIPVEEAPAAEPVEPENDIEAENAGEPEEVFIDQETGEPIEIATEESGVDDSTEEKLKEAEDRVRRVMADLENLRKRSIREKLAEFQRGRRDAAEKLLPVYDSVAMGLLTLKPEDTSRGGLEAIKSQLLNSLQQLGITKVETIGEEFNPEKHEAISQMPHPDHDEGIICEESRAGFEDELGLIRPAQVLVSSGKPEA